VSQTPELTAAYPLPIDALTPDQALDTPNRPEKKIQARVTIPQSHLLHNEGSIAFRSDTVSARSS
jgi:hypothetical protein